MPTSTTDPRPRLPYTGLAGDVFTTARQAAGAAAHTYLAGLDAVAGAQRRLAAGTPLAPVSEILGVQVKLTRRVLEDFVTGETPASPSAVAQAVDEAAPASAPSPAARTSRPKRATASRRSASASAPAKASSSRKSAAPAKRASASAKRATASAKRAASPAKTASSAAKAATNAATTAATTAAAAGARTAAASANAAVAPARAAAATVAPTEPFAGYGTLTAEQIVGRLRELSQRELAAVRAFEAAADARQTILDRVEALTAPEPLPGYDELTVEDIQPRLTDGGPAVATRVLEYERRHKQRAGVIEAAERQAAKD
jgi:hypothetical protein